MTDDEPSPSNLDKVKGFVREAAHGVAQKWAQRIIEGAGIALIVAVVILFAAGGEVPAAILALTLIIAGAALFVLRRYYLGQIAQIRKEEVSGLKEERREMAAALDRHDSYDNHIVRVLDYFQRVLAKDMKISVARFIEAGVLQASREVMIANGHDQDLRLSVLLVEGDHFKMAYAAGHDLESQQKYRVPVADTLSEVAMEQRVTQVWKDVTTDRHFKENPHATRGFRSMVSVPILVGDEPVAVFNVITDRVDAFDATDVSCCTSLGSAIQVALGMAIKEAAEAETRKLRARQKPRTLRRPITRPAPPGSVGSTEAPDRQEGLDG